MGRLGSGGWSGVGEVRVGVGWDVIGFKGFQVMGLGSGMSKELGGWGSLGRVEIKEFGGVGVGELGSGVRFGRLGLGKLESGLGKLGLGGTGGWDCGLGFGGWIQGLGWLGSGGGEVDSGGLGLGGLVGIRGVEVGGELGSKELE